MNKTAVHFLISVLIVWGVFSTAFIFSAVNFFPNDKLSVAVRGLVHGGGDIIALNTSTNKSSSADIKAPSMIVNRLTPGTISYGRFVPPEAGRAAYVDVKNSVIALFVNGQPTEYLNISYVARESSLWEVFSGEYKVVRKEDRHQSPFSKSIFPRSVFLGGNIFVHSMPEDTSGRPVQIFKNGVIDGSIALLPDDAKIFYDFAEDGMPVSISASRASTELSADSKNFAAVSVPVWQSPKKGISVKSKTFVVRDGERQIFASAASSSLPIASISKLFTAIVAIENIKPDEIITISKGAVATYGRQGNLVAGEKFSLEDTLNVLLLTSSNDAAEALAEKVGREKFIALMNEKAASLGLAGTRFADPSGLSPGNKSTPSNLTTILLYINANKPEILKITQKKSYVASSAGVTRRHIWTNENRVARDLSGFYQGGKDGFTYEARFTFAGLLAVPFSEADSRLYSVALLNSPNKDNDVNTIWTAIKKGFVYANGKTLADVLSARNNVAAVVAARDTASLLFVGDIMLDRGVAQMVDAHGGGDYGFAFMNVPFLKDADIAFGNLEGPVSDVGYDLHNLYSFRMKPAALTAIKNAGFDVLSVANNHIGDFGMTAYEDTLNRLMKSGIAPVGGGLNRAHAKDVRIIEKNGIKFGYIGFSDVGPAWLSKDEGLPYVLSASDPDFDSIIKEAAARVDHLIVSFHFGDEYEVNSDTRQQELAHRAIDDGARIVVGHHPHVTQELEKYKDGVIDYSLGNFIFDQPFSEDTMEGGVLEIVANKKELLEINQSQINMNDHFQPELFGDAVAPFRANANLN